MNPISVCFDVTNNVIDVGLLSDNATPPLPEPMLIYHPRGTPNIQSKAITPIMVDVSITKM